MKTKTERGASSKAKSTIKSTPAPTAKRLPSQQRSQERVGAILAATEAAIAEGGYEGLSVVDIAARAGITHTSIYHYFNSLDEILAMLVSRAIKEFGSEIDAMVLAATSAEDLVEVCLGGIRLGFENYSTRPIARGLWAATRYLQTLRKIDDESNAHITALITERFRELAPGVDRDAIHAAVLLAVNMSTPLCELAISQPKRMQKKVLGEYLEMVGARLTSVLAGR